MAADDTTDDQVNTLASPSKPTARGLAMSRPRACPDEDQILAYLDGRSTQGLRDHIDLHLDGCNDCWLLVQSLLAEPPASSSEPRPSAYRITTFALGEMIAERYRVEQFVGKGGMGEVYLAHDTLMGRRVAVKTPLCTTTDDPSALRKFFDEARNADRITHPNICRIYALQQHRDPSGEQQPIPFFTMEFIDGITLAQRIKQGPLPVAVARGIARQLLEGLRAAHDKRVLHLDFKSDNIMLRRGGPPIEAVLMDFGLSRQRDAALRASQCERGIGTLPYMALEQLEGQRNLTPAVDVYAFGVVLFEMLTQQLPFRERSIGALLMQQLRERAPRPSQFRPELSPELDAFVAKCLNRSPRRRYPDAGAALAALDALPRWTERRSVRFRPAWSWKEAAAVLALSLGATSDATLSADSRLGPELAASAPASAAPAVATATPAPLDGDPAAVELSLRPSVVPVDPAPMPSLPAPSEPIRAVGPARELEPARSTEPARAVEPPRRAPSLPAARPHREPAAPEAEPPPAERARPPHRKLRALPRAPIPFAPRRLDPPAVSSSADVGSPALAPPALAPPPRGGV